MEYTELKYNGMNQIIRYPDGYDERVKSGRKYPLILFCHGAGGRGSDIKLLKGNPFFDITDG